MRSIFHFDWLHAFSRLEKQKKTKTTISRALFLSKSVDSKQANVQLPERYFSRTRSFERIYIGGNGRKVKLLLNNCVIETSQH